MIFSTVRRGGFSLVVVLGMLATPGCAAACSLCTQSFLNLSFPFMWDGLLILGAWRFLYLLTDQRSQSQRNLFSVGVEVLIFVLLLLSAVMGGVLVYLMGAFVLIFARCLVRLRTTWAQPETRLALTLHLVTASILTPIVIHSYAVFAKEDTLDRLRHYVNSGTVPCSMLAKEVAEDPHLDLERIREMIVSSKSGDAGKAFEVLWRRKKPDDLTALKEVVLTIPEEEYEGKSSKMRTFLYFPMWLEGVTGLRSVTRGDLEEWIQEQKVKSESVIIQSATTTP